MSLNDKIKAIAVERGIQYLYHFTQIVNLPGILEHGLLSRRELVTSKYLAYPSDEFRLDDNANAISVSVTRINLNMFASKRHKARDSKWVVLRLSPEILWKLNCRFCWDNAAKNIIKQHSGRLDGPWAFEKMFWGSLESRNGLLPSCPTSPEAEIQVLDRIESSYIVEVIVDRSDLVEPVKNSLNHFISHNCPVNVTTF